MKKLFFTLVACISVLASQGQSNNSIVIGKIDSVNSTILKEQRKIWVYQPRANGSAEKQIYPVVYLLDAESHFNSVVGMIEQLSSVNGNTILPQMIIVGIPNVDRTRDLTPTHVDAAPPFLDSTMSKYSGGGERFMAFIEKELIPHIDALYPTAPYRMLIGHSFGGLTVINTLIHHTKLFNAYISIDPSMWYDQERLLKQAGKALKVNSYAGTSLYLGVANTVGKGWDLSQIKKDTSSITYHMRSVLALSDHLSSNKQNHLNVKWKYYDEDDHSSVVLITQYDALRFFFKDYKLNFSPKDISDPSVKLDALIAQHYKKVSEIMGYSVKPPENRINSLAYQALSFKNFNKAEGLFKLNTVLYPQSSNVYDSMGDYYDAVGDKKQAIENYKKALTLAEVSETRKKLESLISKQ
ncbi:MAG TPA: alpha/beta hydrolase-fold protein [Daejeonella sp.]|nr:alpha/beta hydrolase-fold protein [Daejeonella sp.]